jgi:hypothetical protein
MVGCVQLLYNSTWKFHQLAAGTEKAGGTGPSITNSHLPGHSPPASQAGRRVWPALWPSASLVATYQLVMEVAVD